MLEIYAMRIPGKLSPDVFNSLLKRVSPGKRERIKKYLQEKDKMRSLFGDLLARQVIMEKTGMENDRLNFCTNEYGKPYLKERDDVHFNISHAGSWVVVAVDTSPVGVDIEKIAPVDLSTSEHFLSKDEYSDLMSQEDPINYFFSLWTSKESYIKILGKGLSLPLNSFSIKFKDDESVCVTADGKTMDNVAFACYDLQKNYKVSLCATHRNLPKTINFESPLGLINRFAQ